MICANCGEGFKSRVHKEICDALSILMDAIDKSYMHAPEWKILNNACDHLQDSIRKRRRTSKTEANWENIK